MDAEAQQRFEAAALPHVDAAFNLARWLTRNEHAAEDVVQEAFVRAARYFASFRGGDGRTWLLGIVRNVSFDWLNRQQAASTTTFDEEIHDRHDEASDPAFHAIRSCEAGMVHEALEQLPAPLREALVLRELEGLSYREISTVTNVPIGTVMSRLSRGREQLQARLSGSFQGDDR